MKTIRVEHPDLARTLSEDGEAIIEIAGRRFLVAEVRFVDGEGSVYHVPQQEEVFVREALLDDRNPLTPAEARRYLSRLEKDHGPR